MTDSVDNEPTHEPQFGVIDMVEAFTAMRHEWRGQVKESRQLAEQLERAVRTLEAVDRQAPPSASAAIDPHPELKQLVKLACDTELQLARALDAVRHAERSRSTADRDALQQYFNGLNALTRWIARPLLERSVDVLARASTDENPALDGLGLILARLRQTMQDLGIERIDVLGQPFDGNLMNAIGTVDSVEFPAGYVAEQLAPGYRWKGSLLRFADVRLVQPAINLRRNEHE